MGLFPRTALISSGARATRWEWDTARVEKKGNGGRVWECGRGKRGIGWTWNGCGIRVTRWKQGRGDDRGGVIGR